MRKRYVAKRGGLESKVNAFKICAKLWRHGEETNVTQTYNRQGFGVWGSQLPEAMSNFLDKIAILMPISLHCAYFQSRLKELNFEDLKGN